MFVNTMLEPYTISEIESLKEARIEKYAKPTESEKLSVNFASSDGTNKNNNNMVKNRYGHNNTGRGRGNRGGRSQMIC